MDFLEIFEGGQSKTKKLRVIKYIGSDKKRFKKLVEVFLNGDARSSQCASWPMGDIGIVHPDLITPYFEKFIEKLNEDSQHPAIYRNLLRILMNMDIPKKHHGVLVDFSFKFITDLKYPHGIRSFAIRLAINICKKYPEIARELIMILDEMNKFPQPPSIKCCIRDAFKTLKR